MASIHVREVTVEREGNGKFGVHCGDSIDKVDDGLGIRVEEREVLA